MAQPEDMVWGQIPESDWALTRCDWDTAAPALILGDIGSLWVFRRSFSGFQQGLRRHQRIKIFNKNGFDYADMAIPFRRTSSRTETVKILRAQTVLPGNVVHPVDSTQIFFEKVDDVHSICRFTFPQLEEGAILEFEYEFFSPFYFVLEEWRFQHQLPVRLSHLTTQLDDQLVYNYLAELPTDKQVSNDGKGGVTFANGARSQFSSGVFYMEQLPGVQEEPFVTTMKDYVARIRFQLSEIVVNGRNEVIISTWEKLANDLRAHPGFGLRYTSKKSFRKLVKAVSKPMQLATTPLEKVEIAKKFLESKLKCDGLGPYFDYFTLDAVFKSGHANASELNLMLLAILRASDVPAYPLLTSTRENGRIIQNYPLLEQFNHLMVWLPLSNDTLVVDLGDPDRPIGYPTPEALNYMGWLISDQSQHFIEILPESTASDFTVEAKMQADGRLEATLSGKFDGYSALLERALLKEDADTWKNRLQELYPQIAIDTIWYEHLEDAALPLEIFCRFELPESVQMSGDKAYFDPVIYSGIGENPFKGEYRHFPIDFPFPFTESYTIHVLLPPGWKLDEVLPTEKLQLENNGATLKVRAEDHGAKITQTYQLQVDQLRYQPEKYAELKVFFDRLTPDQHTPFVFSIQQP